MECGTVRTRLEQIRALVDRGFVYFDYERFLEYHYRRWIRPGETVIDIGAHLGRHLKPMIECVGPKGKALAFEPLPFAFETIRDSVHHEGLSIYNVALSDRVGECSFTYAQGSPQESGIKQRRFNSPETANPTQITVKTACLDNFTRSLDSVSFIKIDIEGAEIDCLRGSRETLTRLRPVVSVEYGSPAFSVYGHCADTLFELAQQNGYALFDIFLNHITTIEEWRQAVDFVSWDFIMVPNEKLDDFKIRVCSTDGPKLANPFTATTEKSELEARVRLLSADLEASRSEKNDAEQRAKSLTLDIERLQNSRSWKITAPLRRIVSFFRKEPHQPLVP